LVRKPRPKTRPDRKCRHRGRRERYTQHHDSPDWRPSHGPVGTEGDSLTIALTGVQATGQVGTVSHGGISFDLTGVEATGAAGNVIYVPAPIIIVDDTHDGDYHKKLKKRFDEENQRLKQKRETLLRRMSVLLKASQT
jgi:hypothetical protein